MRNKHGRAIWSLYTAHCTYSMILKFARGENSCLPAPSHPLHTAPPRVCVFRQKALPLRLKAVENWPNTASCPASVRSVAGHQHRGRCRRHSGILFIRLVSEHSGTGLGPLFPSRTGSGIRIFVHFYTRLTGWRTVRHSGILKWGTPCTSILLAVEMNTSCTSTLLLVERNTPCTFIDSCWWCNSCYMIFKNHM